MKAMSDRAFWSVKKRPMKGGARTHFTEKCPKGVGAWLGLPGSDQLCVKEAVEAGVINKNTLIIAVEKDHVTAREIREYLETLPCKFHLHEGALHTFDNLGEVLDGREIDVAFFDFCNQIDAASTAWIMVNQEHIANNCVFGYTFSTTLRGRLHANTIKNVVKAYRRDLKRAHGIKGYVKHATNGMVHIDTTAFETDYSKVNEVATVMRRAELVQHSAEVVSLMFGNVRIEDAYLYRDTTGMCIVSGRKTGFRKQMAFNKFHTHFVTNFPSEFYRVFYGGRRKSNPTLDKQKAMVAAFISEGVNCKGKILVTAGQKAAFTRACNALKKSSDFCWRGIKANVKKQTGHTAMILTK